MDTNLFLQIQVNDNVVAHVVSDQRNGSIVDSGICTNVAYMLNKVKSKYGELDFDLYQNKQLCM